MDRILGQSNEFLEERRILLEHFLKSVLNADGPITTCTTFLNFIGCEGIRLLSSRAAPDNALLCCLSGPTGTPTPLTSKGTTPGR